MLVRWLALGVVVALGLSAAPAAAKTVTFTATSDTFVSSARPGKNYGRSRLLLVDRRPRVRSYVRFDVRLPRGARVEGVSLHVYARSRRGSRGFYVSRLSRRGWRERRTTYRRAPAFRSRLGRARGWKRRGWKRVSLPPRTLKRGNNTFGLATTSRRAKGFGSRQSRRKPRLVVRYRLPGPPCSDGVDNDSDRKVDYPADPGCSNPLGDESNSRCTNFGSATRVGSANFGAASELSGLAASRRNPGVLWTHNDSGDTERVFAMDGTAKLIGTHTVSGNSQQDWEDIAVGPGPNPGTSYLYIGSIGGNSGRHDIYVYRVPEPQVAAAGTPYSRPFDSVVKLPMHYPGSEENNAEALLVDGATGDIYVVTKTYSGPTKVYRYPAGLQNPSVSFSLQLVATVELPAITAGDISAEGGEILLKGYSQSYLWPRSAGDSVGSALGTPACEIPHGNGEAIAFTIDGHSYFTVPEGDSAPLSRFYRLRG